MSDSTRDREQHGTRWRYVRGCRCAVCTECNREYMREYMRKRRQDGRLTGADDGLDAHR